jgi:hypothetical protein
MSDIYTRITVDKTVPGYWRVALGRAAAEANSP